MPRFVVLLHETPPGYPRGTHFDLMLQEDEVLWSWALAELPAAGGAGVPAERLPDHRLAYLDYEGEVSGGRGRVVRVDGGTCQPLPAAAGDLRFRIVGERLNGLLILTPPGSGASAWLVRLAPA